MSLSAALSRRVPARGRGLGLPALGRRSGATRRERPAGARGGSGPARLLRATGVRALGWWLLGCCAVLALLGVLFGWWELLITALAGAIVFVLACLFMIGRPRYSVESRLPGRRLVVGTPARGELATTNAATRRLLGTRMELPIGDAVAAFPLPTLAPGASHTSEFVIPTERRGVVVVGPARSVQGDPFGITGRERRWNDAVEVFVHPRTVSLPGRQAGFIHDLEGHPTAHLAASDMSFHALRTYVPGDDPRHVHWRSSARTGELMVRQFEETRQSRVAVALDLARESYTDADEFEAAVSCAASCALQALREENPLTLITSQGLLPSVSAPRALDELSRVEWTPRVRATQLATQVVELGQGASVVILVTGGGLPLVNLRKACAQFDVDVRVLGIRVAAGEPPSVRATANVSVLAVGGLDELPRTMRRALQ